MLVLVKAEEKETLPIRSLSMLKNITSKVQSDLG